jgi:manganese efflux pump family protein
LDFLSILLIAIGLAMDCFAVSLGIGTSPVKKDIHTVFRITFHFGLFQGLMTFLGWLAGSSIVNLIQNFDHWIAFALLAWVGARMIRESFSTKEEDNPCNPSRGKTLIMLSIATSIDALAVGLSLAFVDGSILISSLVIGVTSLLLSLLGLFIGGKLGCKFGKRMELAGGLVLIGIGLRILLSHLLGY